MVTLTNPTKENVMNNTKSTKRPWALLPEEVDRDYIRIRGTALGGQYKIANVLCAAGFADEARANAKIIVAAPDLLEAVKDWLEWMENNDQTANNISYTKAKAAYDKATA